jgi:hypothetical protein
MNEMGRDDWGKKDESIMEVIGKDNWQLSTHLPTKHKTFFTKFISIPSEERH